MVGKLIVKVQYQDQEEGFPLVNDILITSRSQQEHLKNLEGVLKQLEEASM